MNYFATGAHAYNVYVIQSSATTCSRLNKIYNRKKINKKNTEGIYINILYAYKKIVHHIVHCTICTSYMSCIYAYYM